MKTLRCLPTKRDYHRSPKAGVMKASLRWSLSTSLIIFMREESKDQTTSVLSLKSFTSPIYTLLHKLANSTETCGRRNTSSAAFPLFSPGLRHSQWLTREMNSPQWWPSSGCNGRVGKKVDHQSTHSLFTEFIQCPKCRNSIPRNSYKDQTMTEAAEDAVRTLSGQRKTPRDWSTSLSVLKNE